MKILLVGELNTRGNAGALEVLGNGGSGDRLCKILGMTPEEYEETFDRVNLCYGEWSSRSARIMADMLTKMTRYPYMILLGRKVAVAFKDGERPLFGTGWIKDIPKIRLYLILPHPSGRCRVWNDANNILLARRLVRRMIRFNKEE